ncbi:hypothetical protein [Streptomyces sp. NPDC088739]|uniref:WDGH domain-containing protein n=1 Tax=Streptomyces sp. NPDC088739 TaxID=3365882 RepID=UPI0038246A61
MNEDLVASTTPPPDWAFRIVKTGADPERATMTYGHERFPADWDVLEVADRLASRNRAQHSFYTGPITVTVWALPDPEDTARWPQSVGPVPDDAESFDYHPVAPRTLGDLELEHARRGRQALRMLDDFDRCAHGRHSLDPCVACPNGQSTGNTFAPPGRRVATDRFGDGYFVPIREERDDPKSWRSPLPLPGPDDGDTPQVAALYRERAHLVAALCSSRPAVMIPDPENDGWGIVYVNDGHGQMSWHIAPDDLPLFRGIVMWRATHEWDGHTTEEKYARLRASLLTRVDRLAANDAARRAVGFLFDPDHQASATEWATAPRTGAEQ